MKKSIENLAIEEILGNPEKIKKSLQHRPGEEYVRIGRAKSIRAYFIRVDGRPVITGIFYRNRLEEMKNGIARFFGNLYWTLGSIGYRPVARDSRQKPEESPEN